MELRDKSPPFSYLPRPSPRKCASRCRSRLRRAPETVLAVAEIPAAESPWRKAFVRSGERARLKRAERLGSKLGVLLFQLPPYLRKDLPRLQGFLEQLPRGKRVAVEFRHASWQDEEVYEALRGRAVMLCVTDTDEGDTPFVVTADWGYVRLRRTHYDDNDLRCWVARIAAKALVRTYVYFMHEDEALGTRFAQRLNELWRSRDSG